jgi:dienelactone hydrolase
MRARLLIAMSLVMACSGGGDEPDGGDNGATSDDDAAAAQEGELVGDEAEVCGQLEPRNDSEILLCNDLGQPVIASVAMPAGDPPPGGWPGVVVLHGSGGLYLSHGGGDETCTETLEEQFSHWAEILSESGYAVVMPASFHSRGFCEWNDKSMPEDLDARENLVLRTFDAAAAADYLCNDSRVDCSRLAVLGFSNGASSTVLLMQEQLDATADPRLHQLDNLPPLVGAIAYYPGCGLQDVLFNDLDVSQIEHYYYPGAPVYVAHAEKDPLLDECLEIRDPQVDIVAQKRGVQQDMFELEVYPKAKHGFDRSDDHDPKADEDASAAAQDKTLTKLHVWFAGD